MSSIRSEVRPVLPVVRFDQVLSTESSNEIIANSVRCLLDRLSSAGWERAGLSILASITSNDIPHLCNYDPDVLDLSAQDQSVLRQCLAFFGKRQDIDLGVDREGSAYAKFREAERACALTNSCFRAWSQGRFQFDPFVEGILHTSQRKISELLGRCPSVSEIRPRFGPGATTSTPKKNACPTMKLGSMPACSANLTTSMLESIGDSVFFADNEEVQQLEFEIHSNKLAFVPKNAKIDRAICTEPVLNGMFQNGLGDLMATRLRRVGIDIRDQTPNQRAALYGSISGASATLDLSSASDTVALLLVDHLFPQDWADLFRSLRSAVGQYGRHTIMHYEKVSSMGNGFTFPLETIIFWALAQSVVETVVPHHRIRTLVYGDDIIVPTECAIPLMEVLRAVGFTPNAKKSFWTGNFRESCGKDYVLGVDVRPVYLDGALTGADLFRLHNFFWSKGDFQLSDYWESCIDPTLRTYGPKDYGDGHLWSNRWIPIPPKGGLGGTFFEAWSHRPKRLAKGLADRLSARVLFRPPKWDPERMEWSAQPGQKCYGRVYHSRHFVLVRRLATYVQYQREQRQITLTESDRLRSQGNHQYADRRMPDPQTGDDEDFFVVPGTGPVHRVKIYIFESP